MCLIIKNQKLKKAKENIVCYKVLTKGLISPIQHFEYEINKLFITAITFGNDWCTYDDTSVNYLREKYPNWKYDHKKYDLISVETGFHSFSKRSRINKLENCESIWKCIIPKGSFYYEDPIDQLMVSNQIIIKSQSKYKPKN